MATRPGLSPQMVEKGAHTGARWQLLLFSIDLKLNYFGHSLIILPERGASPAEKSEGARWSCSLPHELPARAQRL